MDSRLLKGRVTRFDRRNRVVWVFLAQYSKVGAAIHIKEKHKEKHNLTAITTLGNVMGYAPRFLE